MPNKSEAEARKCWCPFAGETRISHQTEECIASECMAWRSEGALASGAVAPGPDWVQSGVNEYGTPTWWLAAGYCGLAGKP